ncbi:hypothetical protein GGI18_002056 [Coemansia linderi]|uniref:Uncharacterized protein n=1 Tax=Coemansia linderi TaxID=2663919 RepID=A0ACC1KHH8_9FUNG|nr:hypothetical protein GGI18_002056 [Coemansia linderi]
MVYRKIPGHFGVFELSGVTRMNSISIGSMEVGNEGRHAPGTAVSFIDKQVHRVVEVATVLRLGDGTPTRQLYNAILTAPRTLTVQHLDFRGFPFAAKNAVEIIAALPNLVSLTCRIEETISTIDEMPEDEYPSALLERYGNLNNSFRKLVLVNVVDEEYDYESMDDVLTGEIAIVVVQIAVLCPNLTHVDIPEEMHSVFGREIAWAMLNRPFSPYAYSLRRLLYIK